MFTHDSRRDADGHATPPRRWEQLPDGQSTIKQCHTRSYSRPSREDITRLAVAHLPQRSWTYLTTFSLRVFYWLMCRVRQLMFSLRSVLCYCAFQVKAVRRGSYYYVPCYSYGRHAATSLLFCRQQVLGK